MERSDILSMKYNDLLSHAKNIGVNLNSAKPKKDELIEQLTSYLDSLELDTNKETKKMRTRTKATSYSENAEDELKKPKKKVKKVAKESTEDSEIEEEIVKKNKLKKVPKESTDKPEIGEEVAKKKTKKKVSKATKSKKKVEASEVTEAMNKESSLAAEEVKKVTKVKKSLKHKPFKDCDTYEMKRIRQSIADRKALSESVKTIKRQTRTTADEATTSPVANVIKMANHSDGNVNISPDEQFKLNMDDDDDSYKPIEHEIERVKPRKSVAFEISKSPQMIKTPLRTPAKDRSMRKSIAFVIENSPDIHVTPKIVRKSLTLNRTINVTTNKTPETMPSATNDHSSILTNDDSNDANNTFTFDKTYELNQVQKTQVEEVKPRGRPRIVIPTNNVKTIEKVTVISSDTDNDFVVKKMHINLGGPRIVKPTNTETESSSTTSAKKKFPAKSSVAKVSTKMPDFKSIHNKNFSKSENLSDNVHRVQQRHSKLSGHKLDEHTQNENNNTALSTNLYNHASNLLKKIVPFSKNENPSKIDKTSKDSNIPKFRSAIEKPVREPFTTTLKTRTPLAARTLNSIRTPVQPPRISTSKLNINKTPQSSNKPKASSLLKSTDKPVLSKPFQFQTKNLEANINLGNACQFGLSTGTTPLKESAFNRRKSYNPAESICRGLSYNPHVGRLKPVDGGVVKANLNESTSIKVPYNGANEKRKSILGKQRNLEKDKQNTKRKFMRNKEMDKPRVLNP